MSDQTPPVAPSATPDPEPLSAADQAAMSGDVSAYRAARQAERLGKPLDPTPAAQPADSAPAQPEDQAGERPEPAPASEPGKPSGHKGNADTRVQELLRERAELRRQLAEADAHIRRGGPLPPSPTQPTKPAAPAAAPAMGGDTEPQLADFEADPDKYPDPYAAYVRAISRYEARQERIEAERAERTRREAEERTRATETRDQQFRERLAAERQKDPAWTEAIAPEVLALRPFNSLAEGERATGYHAVAEEIVRSERPADLMRHFSAHLDDLHRIASLPPRELLREMGRLEARLDAPAAPAPSRPLTSAPPPPVTLGARPAEPADPVEAAIKNDDVRAYRAARLRERQARVAR